jgi:hypothetical protein
MLTHNIPDSQDAGFARTHRQKIAQRIALICALWPETRSITEHARAAEHQCPCVPAVRALRFRARRLRRLPVPQRHAGDARDRPPLVPAVLEEPEHSCHLSNTTPNPPSARWSSILPAAGP